MKYIEIKSFGNRAFINTQYIESVIEIDGKQHYADGDRASPRLYSEMVKAQREMSLYGYDVYRFGGYEFKNAAESDSIKQELLKNLKEFFVRLFQKYNILER